MSTAMILIQKERILSSEVFLKSSKVANMRATLTLSSTTDMEEESASSRTDLPTSATGTMIGPTAEDLEYS